MSDITNTVTEIDFRQAVWDRCEEITDAITWLRGLEPSLQSAVNDGLEAAPAAASEAVMALLAAQRLFIERLAGEVEGLQRSSAG